MTWLTFTIQFVIKLQCVLSNQICYRVKYLNPICKTNTGELIQYKPAYESLNENQIQYIGHSINVICHHAFIEYEDDFGFGKYIKGLVLDLSDKDIIIEPSAIVLTKLERLEINSGPVQLESNSFQNLSNLQHLKIKVNEGSAKMSQVLKNLPRLKSLELLDNYNIDICEFTNTDTLQIKILGFMGGFIRSISSKSFECNDKFNIIPANIFDNITELKILDLSYNSISKLDNTYLTMSKNCELLNLSYNSMESIENGFFKNIKCITLDLGGNEIKYIANNEFKNSMIDTIFNEQKNQTLICYESKNHYFKICQKKNQLVSVIARTMPYRLSQETLIFEDSDIILTEDYIFYNLTIKNLIIESSAKPFQLIGESLKGLPKLKNLQLDTQPILIKNPTFFYIRDTLERLSLSLSSNSFDGLSKLENLELNVGLTVLEHGAFYRLTELTRLKIEVNGTKHLQYLRVTKTSLTTIERDAFFGLDYLEKINLSYNNIKRIVINVFNNLRALKILRLNNNNITGFDIGSLMTINNDYTLINVSYNKIVDIPERTFGNLVCKVFDIRENPLLSSKRTIMGYSAEIGELIDRLGQRHHPGQHFKISDDEPRRNSFPVCERDSFELIHYDRKYADYEEDIDTINVDDSDIILLQEYAFDDGHSETKTKKLILSLSDGNLIIEKNAFTKLTRLESLEITRVNETWTRLSEELQDIPNLESLEILDNGTIGICDSFEGELIISQLQYTGGEIYQISDSSFECLTQLKTLKITETQLSVIGFDAFSNLNKLKVLSITMNQNLSYIPPHNNGIMRNLETLDLTSSSESFKLNSEAFKGLSTLKNLVFKTYPISMEQNNINTLKKLEHLVISLTLSTQNEFCMYVELLKTLKSLILIEHGSSYFCNDLYKSKNEKLRYLQYQKTYNLISFIGDDAFRLQKSNYLPTDCTFHGKTEDFCKPETLSVLDLSFNKLEHLRNDMLNGILIEHIDLSNNDIMSPDDYEFDDYKMFDDSNKLQLFLDKEYEKNIKFWCFDETSFMICMKNHELLFVTHNDIDIRRKFNIFGPKNPSEFVSNLVLGLYIDDDFLSIQPFAFVNMTSRNQVKTLTIDKHSRGEFIFVREIFAGLIALENFELNVGPVKLRDRHFDNLHNLKSLKIEAIDDEFYLIETLQSLRHLESLEIVGNAYVGICNDPFANSIPAITNLSYTSGLIKKLRKKSLTCLTYLEKFKISHTLLRRIEEDAFYGLSHLKIINLAHNELKHIPINVFNHIHTLNVLELNDNRIVKIDVHALTMQDNFPYYSLLLLDLSNNELKNLNHELEGLKCKVLDLSGNDIDSDNILFFNSCIRKIIISLNNTMSLLNHCQK
ncbi:protein artichoke-like [Aphidius gifuensis]|uniref:protein artichoke-like n=1 Tax=Aphidius gifuensis TaxID=684658 RepID=UPI001CDB4834|nr:protein artichoke-like [Aphidius gifuensis]